jgi:hypothetical protein
MYTNRNCPLVNLSDGADIGTKSRLLDVFRSPFESVSQYVTEAVRDILILRLERG